MVTAMSQLAMVLADIITGPAMVMPTTTTARLTIIGSSGDTIATETISIISLNIGVIIADNLEISIVGNIGTSIVQEPIMTDIIGPIADIIATIIKPV